MAITREKKARILEKLADIAAKSKSVVFVGFSRLSVADATAMRRALKALGVGYMVAKKTLIRRALAGSKIAGEIPELPGEVALAYGGDLIAPAREVNAFAAKRKESLAILGGVFDGRFLGQSEMQEIASIPPVPVLHAKLAYVIKAPLQKLAVALAEVAKAKSAASAA